LRTCKRAFIIILYYILTLLGIIANNRELKPNRIEGQMDHLQLHFLILRNACHFHQQVVPPLHWESEGNCLLLNFWLDKLLSGI